MCTLFEIKRNQHVIIVESLDIQQMYAREMLLQNLVVTFIIKISIDINNLSVDMSLSTSLRSMHLKATIILENILDTSLKTANYKWNLNRNWERRIILAIWITTHGINVLHMESMVIIMKNAWDYILEGDLVTRETLAWHVIITTKSVI